MSAVLSKLNLRRMPSSEYCRPQDSDVAGTGAALREVLLVIFLRAIKFRRGNDLRDDWATEIPRLLELRLGRLGFGFLLRRVVEDNRPVLIANIRPLPVHRGRVVILEKNFEQLLVADLGRIVFDVHHLRMAGPVRADLLVGGVLRLATLIPDGRFLHAGGLAKRFLHAPETTRAE